MAPEINIYIYVNGDLLLSRTTLSIIVQCDICQNSCFILIVLHDPVICVLVNVDKTC